MMQHEKKSEKKSGQISDDESEEKSRDRKKNREKNQQIKDAHQKHLHELNETHCAILIKVIHGVQS
jgi:hypothetical protein